MDKDLIKTYSFRISQASRTDLIVIMYDMAIDYLGDARSFLNKSDMKEFHDSIKKAKRVIDSLSTSLDMQYEISVQLYKEYMVLSKILQNAGNNKDESQIVRLIAMLKTLRKSFYEVSKQDTSGTVMKNTQQVYAGLTYSNTGSSNEVYLRDGFK